jgi:WhiB family redox-sensing transcriptional regulator
VSDDRIDLDQIGSGLGPWADHAACATSDPEAFLSKPDPVTGEHDDRAALAICARCPVLLECAAYGEENDERFGIWGGLRRDRPAPPWG